MSSLLLRRLLPLAAVCWLAAGDAAAAVVRFTTARALPVRESVELTGTVEATRTAMVASAVAGMVEQRLAIEGTRVGRGDPLVRLHRDPLELRLRAARAQLTEAEARLKSAKLRLERFRELQGSEVVSRQTLDDVAYEAEALEGRAEQLRAEAARLEHDLERTTVRAPFAGVVGRVEVEAGEWLDVGSAVAELVALDPLEVRLEVPERYFGALRAGGEVRIRVEALPGLEIAGEVRAVVPRADPRSRTFPVLVRLPNPERRLGVGMLARIALPLGETAADATLVPKDAILSDGDGSYVFVLDGGSAVRRVRVEVGTGVDQWVAVRGALAAGAKVVTRGNEGLADGQEVEGEAERYPPPGGGAS